VKLEGTVVFDEERATNRLLFALSQHPEGLTSRDLAEFSQQSKEQVVQLLGDSGYTQKSYAGPQASKIVSILATLWKLKKYVPGSASGEDLKARIKAGSRR